MHSDLDPRVRAERIAGLLSLPFLTVDEVAEILSLSAPTVRRMVATGQLRAIRLGTKSLRVRPEWVTQLADSGDAR